MGYSFTFGDDRCLADARVRAIFEEYAFLLEATFSNVEAEGFQRPDDKGRILYRGLKFLPMVGRGFKWSFTPFSYDGLQKAGANWEMHQLGAYRRIAKLLPANLAP